MLWIYGIYFIFVNKNYLNNVFVCKVMIYFLYVFLFVFYNFLLLFDNLYYFKLFLYYVKKGIFLKILI